MRESDKVDAQRHCNAPKGFRVFTMDGPTPDHWTLIATRTTDVTHQDAPIGQPGAQGHWMRPTILEAST